MPLDDYDKKVMADIAAQRIGSIDTARTVVHRHMNNPDRLHQIAEDSHQDHKSMTGQVPDEDQGYTTYTHQGPFKNNSGDRE